MHFPMSRSEIGLFLGIRPSQVEALWASGHLKKSLSCPYRLVEALNYSTVYDVLEFALTLHGFAQSIPKDVAVCWVELLAEVEEWDDFTESSFEKRIKILLAAAVDAGLTDLTSESRAMAGALIFLQDALMHACGGVTEAS